MPNECTEEILMRAVLRSADLARAVRAVFVLFLKAQNFPKQKAITWGGRGGDIYGYMIYLHK